MLVVLALVSVPSASAAEKGVVTDLTWGISDADQNRALGALLDLKAHWAKITINWRYAEPTAPDAGDHHYDPDFFASTDRAIALLRAAGIKIIVGVSETPQWESGSTNQESPPTDPQQFANFVGYVAGRYKGKVAGWQIWNEENTPWYWSGSPDPAKYAQLLKLSHSAVKAVDPGAKVVFGGIAWGDYQYLESVYAAEPNLGSYFDVMGVHPYAYNNPPEAYTKTADGRIEKHSFRAYREIRATMLAHGDDKPFWMTEIGWANASTPPEWHVDSETTVASYLTRAFKFIETDPYVKVALWYDLRNNWWAKDADDWLDQLGLMRTDFSRKPSYYAFRDYGAPAPSTAAAKLSTSVRVGIRRLRSHRFRVSGRVSGVRAGTVKVEMQRLSRGRRWRRAASLRLGLSTSGKFRRKLKIRRSGRLRLRVRYLETARYAGSVSRFVYFRVARPR